MSKVLEVQEKNGKIYCPLERKMACDKARRKSKTKIHHSSCK